MEKSAINISMALTLNTVKDKTGTVVHIKFAPIIGQTPVALFYLKAYAELIEMKLGQPIFTVDNANPAVYAEINGKVVGHIVYQINTDPLKTAWIWLSSVDAQYRKRGIYNLMHVEFEKLIRANGSRRIASHVHVNNIARQTSCESVGMKKVWFKMEKDLNP